MSIVIPLKWLAYIAILAALMLFWAVHLTFVRSFTWGEPRHGL
jgi:hypothetical protein